MDVKSVQVNLADSALQSSLQMVRIQHTSIATTPASSCSVCCSETHSPWLDLDICQFMLQHLAKCFVCLACSSFLSSQTPSLGCVDPFLFSHVWMSACISCAMWFQPTQLTGGGDTGAQISVLMCSHPTEFLHLRIRAGLGARLQANSQAPRSTKAFSLEQRLKPGALMTTERNSPSVKRWELKPGLCVWVWYPTQKAVWVTESKSLEPGMRIRSAGFWTRATAWRPHQDDELSHLCLTSQMCWKWICLHYFLFLHVGEEQTPFLCMSFFSFQLVYLSLCWACLSTVRTEEYPI